jgi:hypothetical protein
MSTFANMLLRGLCDQHLASPGLSKALTQTLPFTLREISAIIHLAERMMQVFPPHS